MDLRLRVIATNAENDGNFSGTDEPEAAQHAPRIHPQLGRNSSPFGHFRLYSAKPSGLSNYYESGIAFLHHSAVRNTVL